MLPTDIDLLPVLGRPTIAADGRYAVYDVTRSELGADTYATELWIAATDGSTPPRRLTQGPYDGAPAMSPDGNWLAFLRPVPGGRAQIHLLPMSGGEAYPITDHPLGAGQPAWSRDSRAIAYAARTPEPGRYTGDPDAEAPRRITSLVYLLDGFGYTFDRPRQVHVTYPFETVPRTVQVTSGEYDHGDIDWSPDGQLLTFVSARHETYGDDSRRDVWVCAPDGTGLRPLTDGGMYLFGTRFSSDGRSVCFSGAQLDKDNHSSATASYGLWSADVLGDAEPRRLTDGRFHLSFASQLLTPSRDGVYFACDNQGAVNLILVPYDGGEPTPVITGPRQVNGYAIGEGPQGTTVAAVIASAQSAGDLVSLYNGVERVLTPYGRELQENATLRPMEPFTAKAPDGYLLSGWVVRPDGPGPHPVIFQVKGGPFTQWGYTLTGPAAFDEAQVYASAGYAVVLGNPRGCAGYGQEHGSYVADDLPRRSAPDLLALLQTALEQPDLDATRVGIMGGSFGGYMAAWMSAHHPDHFRAAIGERGLYSIDSYAATSDDGVDIAIALYGSDRDRWAELSPLTYADQMRLPMMIIQAEQDKHCPMEQAQRLFTELRLRDIPAEMLLFPGEGHDMSRTGLPSHRVARYDAILDWWARYLGPDAQVA